MEILDFSFALAVLVSIIGVVMFAIFRLNPAKDAQKAGAAGVKSMYEVYNLQVNDVMKLKDNQIKRLNAKLNEYAEDEEPDQAGAPAVNVLEGLKPLLASRNINPAILDLPFVKNLIKKYTKDMNIEDIAAIAQQFGIAKGSGQSGIPDSSTASTDGKSQYF